MLKTKPQLKEMMDNQLESLRKNLPKYKNDMTEEQLELADAIYAEQLRRYKKKIKEYNNAATEATGLKHGDDVVRFQPNAFGIGGEEYIGRVMHDRNGRLVIRTKRCDGAGHSTFPINKGWKKIEYT